MADRYAQVPPRPISDEEAEKVADTLRLFTELQNYRNVFAGQWEESAALMLTTSRNTFFYGSYNWPGMKKTQQQVDGTAGLALHRFCAIADSLVTPRNMQWHGLEADDEYVNKDRQVQLWYENTTRKLFRYRYAPNANFAAQNYNSWQSLGAFGNATMFTDRFDGRLYHGARGLRYRSVPLGETFFAENHQGVVNIMVRWFRGTAQQAAEKWGIDALPGQLRPQLNMQSQTPFNFLHCVKPRAEDDYDPERLDARGKPFESYYVSIEGKCLMGEEGGYRVFPFAVRRYDVTPGEQYGRGPAQIVLPALKTLNAEKAIFLKTGHRASDPVLLLNDDGLMGMDQRPGAVNPGGVNAQGQPLVHILPTGDVQITEKMMGEERGLIQDTFLTSLFEELRKNPNMTATQVIELVNEKGMLVAPTLGRQHDEISQQIIRELDLLAEMGVLDPMPPRLREAGGLSRTRIKDTSPLARAARMNEAAGFNRWIENLREIVSVTQDQSWLDPVNADVASPEIADILGVPVRWTSPPALIAQKRKARAAAQQRQQQIESAPGQAALMNAQAKVAKATGFTPPGIQQPQQQSGLAA